MTETKDWSWAAIFGDNLRNMKDVQILDKQYHILMVFVNEGKIVSRVKEEGKQEVEEIKLMPNTMVYYKKKDEKSLMDILMGEPL